MNARVRSPAAGSSRALSGVRSDPPEDERAIDAAAMRATLGDAVAAMEAAAIPYLVMGGVGSAKMGRPRHTHDADLFVAPEMARPALAALERAGFSTEERDPRWLFKAWKRNALVDIIFRSSRDIYLDDEMLRRGQVQDFEGYKARVMSAEDLIVIKAVTADEHVIHHWFDALALVAGSDLDWGYLSYRARRHGVRRILSLLLFAESNDVSVDSATVRDLFHAVHSETPGGAHEG
jgi:hypothetical protein